MRLLLVVLILASFGCAKDDTAPKQGLVFYLKTETSSLTLTEKVDFVREFVHNNSQHGDYSDQWAANIEEVSLDLYESFKTGQKINMKCGLRSTMQLTLLKELGIDSRRVSMWASNGGDGFFGHALLEFYSPEQNKWIITDADYNVFYTNLAGDRLSLNELIMTDLDQVLPCDGINCDWDISNKETAFGMSVRFLRDHEFYGVAVIHTEQTVTINTNRYDPNLIYPDILKTVGQYHSELGYEVFEELGNP